MRFAIDLLWVRPNKVGGTEFYIRNILNGLLQLEDRFEVVLVVAKDNASTFEHYFTDERFKKVVCDINCLNVGKRILWQNMHLSSLIKRLGVNICFEPVYSKPFFTSRKIKFITTIHDLQALHYPQYQSKSRVQWLKHSWRNSVKTSYKIIAISNFVKEDIIERYKVPPDKVVTIHNAIELDTNDVVDSDILIDKFNVTQNEFYYTVASLAPHKNLKTLVNVMKAIKDREIDLPMNLLVSGISGKSKDEILAMIREYGLEENVRLVGFVEKTERNTLYKHCRAFLFPSVFEGFGMPPVEAMAFGGNVITTKKASLYEVTQGKATYVDDPYNVEEWIDAMTKFKESSVYIDMSIYDAKYIAAQYLKCFSLKLNQLSK